MADPAVLTRWPLPDQPAVAQRLLRRWSEPHRRYHDVRHLGECLTAADALGAGSLELLALWFHDAVHRNRPGRDEADSGALAREWLDGVLPAAQVAEVQRLVLLTARHRPVPGDRAGAIVCDADLWVLGAPPARYAESVRDLRSELGLPDADWPAWRRAGLLDRLARPIFHGTYPDAAASVREEAARRNLTAELAGLSSGRS